MRPVSVTTKIMTCHALSPQASKLQATAARRSTEGMACEHLRNPLQRMERLKWDAASAMNSSVARVEMQDSRPRA